MAANTITFDPATLRGARILQSLRAIREGAAILTQELLSADQALQGDSADPASFTLWSQLVGAVANDYPDAPTAAKAGFDELNSLAGKLNAPAGQGDATGAAIQQACAKFGV